MKRPHHSSTLSLFSFILILLLAAIACAGGMESAAPAPSHTQTTAEDQPTQTAPQPAVPEQRRLTLEFPSRMRAGAEAEIVRLTLEVDAQGNVTPTAEFEGNVVVGEVVEIPNLYETHDVIAEARFDIAGMQVMPPDAVMETLLPGKKAVFLWSIRPPEPGTYRGTVWLHLNFVERSTGRESRTPLSAQIIEIQAVDFLGLPVSVARTSGMIGSVVGGIMGFPFLEDILKFLHNRLRRRRSTSR